MRIVVSQDSRTDIDYLLTLPIALVLHSNDQVNVVLVVDVIEIDVCLGID